MTFRNRLRFVAVPCLAALLVNCAGAPRRDAPPATRPAIEEVADRLAGSFSSAAQSKADPEYFDVRLEMVRIWNARADGPWIYVEQAMATALDKPYRQRVYRLIERGDGSVESVVYELPSPADWAGGWREPARFDSIEPESLVLREGCSIVLRRAGDVWIGSTNERDCASSLRGASYATSEVTLRTDGLDSWDRGFDAAGSQVWGAKKGAYEFRR